MSSNNKPFGPRYKDAVHEMALMRGAKNSKLNVLNAILSFCNSTTGQAFPGNAKIMRRAGVTSKGTLDIALRWLKEQGLLVPVAYQNGGHGRSVVWGFGLPAWSTPDTIRTSPKSGEDEPEKNLPEIRKEPPRNSTTTSPNFGEPTELTNLTGKGNEDTAGRRGGQWPAGPEGPRTPEEQQLFIQFLRGRGYGEAMDMLKEHRAKPPVAAE